MLSLLKAEPTDTAGQLFPVFGIHTFGDLTNLIGIVDCTYPNKSQLEDITFKYVQCV